MNLFLACLCTSALPLYSMGSFSIIPTTFIFISLIPAIFGSSYLITPNYSVSYLHSVEDYGAFLYSQNQTFKAALYNPGNQQTNFYLCVIHVASHTVIWSANRDAPVSNSGKMLLSPEGITVSDQNGNRKWSTPRLISSVVALILTDIGNLVLLDQNNASLWESFHSPTDTVVMGQSLPVGTSLISSVSNSDDDLSSGNYSLSVTTSDTILQWGGSTYWKLSMDPNAHRNSNYVVEYLLVDAKGLYLFARNGSIIVLQVNFFPSEFRIAKVNPNGQLIIRSYSGRVWNQDFVWPRDSCGIPYICGAIKLCSADGESSGPVCSCPSGFIPEHQASGCIPSDTSLSLPLSCDSSHNQTSENSQNISYQGLGVGKYYFAIRFSDPIKYGINSSMCQNFCSKDCSCMGFFHRNSTGSCFLIHNHLGSFMSNVVGGSDLLGYIKIVDALYATEDNADDSNGRRQVITLVALIIFPFVGLLVAAGLCLRWWRNWMKSKVGLEKSGNLSSLSSGDLEAFSIPGLPVRYDYEELREATDNFSTQIGSGGFGAVYKGKLPDKSVVAVKKITNLGVEGKREFCTEIAVIGNIRHVNLVKLKGYCVEGNQRLLVYEYMNHGSMDRTLFGNGPVLEWQERVDIALGTAHALAYLHSGCERKIIHCDVKPENILLHDHFQPKVSDFGLSKLLNPEQSSHFTTMRGTRGYLAPEWLTSSGISEKTDVYSYGMVLLELVSGRKNCSLQPMQQSHSLDDDNSFGISSSTSSNSGVVYFPMLALEMHEQGRYLELADLRLEGRVTSEEVQKLVCIALCCAHEDPGLRPSMGSVVGMLEGRISLGHPRLEALNFLRFYGRRFAEPCVVGNVGEQSDRYHQLNASQSASEHSILSYTSSQQVSGPR
ncbi:G-type lectin S-receptor-like serine/threonine-protein kinase At5g35370 isoform X1 [Spinacia oleracea]|uniref:Receptor-like serine/threonine-protein kinase n=1 Tax=Spinacia oleracea TaxID=3562 RepID=A0A9R0K310_SPIOL|nr:G-type lectin S-receptor-like serine/threonine-protein kinase At5g35370 isoform X1 [Spinacia oleracea]